MNKNITFLTLISIVLQTALMAETEPLISWRTHTQETSSVTQTRALLRTTATERQNGLAYINALRTGAGLVPYSANSMLDAAAQNHMDYLLDQNTFSHNETNLSSSFYTGYNAGDRMTAAGYSWSSYGENLSSGDADIYGSIDGLFSAIYHRFGFLDLLNNELGIGSATSAYYGNMYNYNSANTAWWETRPQNPAYVLWPHNNFDNAQTSFNNYEAPDPVPECPAGGITGNPISIEFNPDKNSAITMNSFKLFDSNDVEVTNTKILTNATDPNGYITTNQFVLFPMNALSLDSNYRTEFRYSEANTTKTITWQFATKRYDEKRYEVVDGGVYDLISGQSYILHLKPNDCNTVLSGYSWNNNSAVVQRLSSDIFRISITSNTDFSFGNFSFSLRTATSDTAIAPSTSITQSTHAALSIISFLLSSN